MQGQLLGRGSYGYVIRDGEFALKIIPLDIENQGPVPSCEEGEIGERLTNPTVVKCSKFGREGEITLSPSVLACLFENKIPKPEHFYFLKTEYCNGGSLQDWITSIKNPSRTQGMVEYLFAQCLEAVRYLGSEGVIHGDLKPQNIYLHSNEYGKIQLRVGDFGEAFYETRPNGKEQRGTEMYQDKNLRGEKTKGYDVYSLALIYYILFMSGLFELDQDLVWTEKKRQEALHNLLRSVKIKGHSELMSKTHPKIDKFLSKMLDVLESRPTVEQVQKNFSDIMTKNKKNCIRSCPIPGQNPLFQGREEVFHKVERILTERILTQPPAKSGITCIFIEGVPGVGKMSTAVEIVHRKSESKEFSHFIAFKADSRTKLRTHYSNFKAEKNLKRNNLFSFKNNTVTDWFHTQTGWIAVYENVTNFKEVNDLIPSPLKNTTGTGLVICTSRSGATEYPEYFTKIPIDKLTMGDCIRLIDQSLNLTKSNYLSFKTPEELGKQEELIKLMDYLPTAICQCMVHILGPTNEAVKSVGTYLDYHTKALRRLDKGALELLNFSKSGRSPIYATNLLTIDRIKSICLPAFQWLKICAYLDPDDISDQFFDEFIRQTGCSKTKTKILTLLKDIAMLEELVQENGSHFFRISRVVQETMRIFYSSDFSQTISEIDDIFKAIIPQYSDKKLKEPGRVLFLQSLTSHCETLVNHVNKSAELEKELNVTADESQALQSSSCYSCFLTCGSVSKPLLLNFKARLLKGIVNGSKSLMHQEQTKVAECELEKVKTLLFGDRSLQRGTTLMAQGNSELNAATVARKEDREALILKARKKLEDAAEILSYFWEPEAQAKNRKHHEIYQCYLYLGYSYKAVTRKNCRSISFDQLEDCQKNPTNSQPQLKTRNEMNEAIAGAVKYYEKALAILIQAVRQNFRLLKTIGSTLRRMANTCVYLDKYETMEKYLLLGLEFILLHEMDHRRDSKDERTFEITSRINDKITFLENIDKYKVTDDSLKIILADEMEFSVEKAGVLKTLSSCYTRRMKLLPLLTKSEGASMTESCGLEKTLKAKINYIDQVRSKCKSTCKGLLYDKNMEFAKPKRAKELQYFENPAASIQDDNNTFLAQTKINSGIRLKKARDFNKAIQNFEEALEMYLKDRDNYHMDTGFLYEKIGECYAHDGLDEKACQNYEMSYAIVKKNLKIRIWANISNNIRFGVLIQKYVKVLPKGSEVLKISLLQEALEIYKTFDGQFGKNKAQVKAEELKTNGIAVPTKPEDILASNTTIPLIMQKIGRLQIDIGHFAYAQTILKDAWDIFETKLRPGHQNRISCLNMLQQCYQKLPNQAELKKCQNALELEKNASIDIGIRDNKPDEKNKIKKQRVNRNLRKEAKRKRISLQNPPLVHSL